MEAEQNLWVAVVATAIQEALKTPIHTNRKGEEKRHMDYTHILNAREWLDSNSDDFRITCHLAGLEPEYVKRKWIMLNRGDLNPKEYFTDRTY
jgi:hypothetical protein|tara:strand:+ start:451 stop:729 length:279 start_codon:yes stop_codon:yes gene_type:complete